MGLDQHTQHETPNEDNNSLGGTVDAWINGERLTDSRALHLLIRFTLCTSLATILGGCLRPGGLAAPQPPMSPRVGAPLNSLFKPTSDEPTGTGKSGASGELGTNSTGRFQRRNHGLSAQGVAESTSADVPSIALSDSAAVRGQSPDGWQGTTPASSEAYRSPMPVTDVSPSGSAAANQMQSGQASSAFVGTGGGQRPAGTRIAPASPTNFENPQGSTPPWNGAAGISTNQGANRYPSSDPATGQLPNNSNYPPGANAVGPQSSPNAVSPSPNDRPIGQTGFGYGAPNSYQAPGGAYGSTIAPGSAGAPQSREQTIAPGAFQPDTFGGMSDPMAGVNAPNMGQYRPRQRIAPIDVYVQEARTGRVMIGGSVNSDLGVAGQLIVDERNFDIGRLPTSWDDLWSGRAFRGAGQNFRLELMPGNRVERYTVSWSERNLFGYLPYSLSVGGFLFTRQFRDWTEQRLGGRVALGYEVTRDLSISSEIRMEDVKLFDARVNGVSDLDSALGSNDIYTARFRIAHDTRDSPFMASEGHLFEIVFDQVFGEYDYSRGNVNYSRYFLLRQRPDGTGRHVLASTHRFGVTGSQTPIFENYFAGGYSTLRGFSFRGASPVVGDVQVGGELMMLGSLEYIFPLTADEMLRGVAFVDYGTVEQDIEFNSENFRVAPGLGLRVTVPALGPAPLAFDFAYPINYADNDDRQVFSFFMGFTR